MIPAAIQQQLTTLSISQKIVILNNCINRLIKIYSTEFKEVLRADSSAYKEFVLSKFKSKLEDLQKQLPIAAKVAIFVATGDDSKFTVDLVCKFALAVKEIIDNDIYKLMNISRPKPITKTSGRNAQPFGKVEEDTINELIVFVAELTAGVDIKFKYAHKNYSILRVHAGTFTREASNFITQVIKQQSNANQYPNTHTPLPKIRNLEQNNNKKTVAALIKNYSIISTNQLDSHCPDNHKSKPAWEVRTSSNVKLTIR